MAINNNRSIFIHSLFRSGSTYIFNAFRRSDLNYYCYQEPLNEHLLYAGTEPNKLLNVAGETQKYLRHPNLDKPYFFEFYEVADKVAQNFRKEFSYDQYFSEEEEDIKNLNKYFNALENGAKGRAVFQCCRTTGRVASLQNVYGAVHVFLWRNPWDQWWSYKKGFETNSLLTLNANNLPSFLVSLKTELNIPNFHDEDTFQEYAFFKKNKLDSVSSYKVFYALWCHAMLEAKPNCALSINMEQLSLSSAYRKEIAGELEKISIEGLDFSDCSIPMAQYGESDADFFLPIEECVHELLLLNGYTHEQVDELKKLSSERKLGVLDTSNPANFAVRDAMRVRDYLQVENAETVFNQSSLIDAEYKTNQAEAKAEQAEAKAEQAEAKAEQAEAKAEQAEAKAEQAEAKAEQAETKAEQLQVELNSVYASRSWRITKPLRWCHFQLSLLKEHGITARSKALINKSVRSIVFRSNVFLSSRPKLRATCLKLLKKTGFYSRVHKIYRGPIVYSAPTAPKAELRADLTPSAQRIYHELKAAIDKNREEN